MSMYMDFIPLFAGDDGVIRGPAGDGRVGAVLRDDVADACAAVLTGDGHDGETYDVTGPRPSRWPRWPRSFPREAQVATRRRRSRRPGSRAGACGRRTGRSRAGSPRTSRSRPGELDLVTDTVERLAGHPPADLADWLRS